MQLEPLRKYFTSLLILFVSAQAVVLVLLYTRARHYVALRTDLHRLDDVRNEVGALRAALTEAETGQRGFVITGREEFLQPYRAAILSFPSRVERLRSLLAGQPGAAPRLDTLASLLTRTQADLARLVDVRRHDGFEAAQKFMLDAAQHDSMDQLRALAIDLDDEAQKRAQSGARAQTQSSTQLINLAFFAVCGGLLVTVGLGLLAWARLGRLALERNQRLLELARGLRTAAKSGLRDAANLVALAKSDATSKAEEQATLEVITRMAKELSTVAMEITASVRVLVEDPVPGQPLDDEAEMQRIVSLAGRVAQSALSIELTTSEQLRQLDAASASMQQREQSVKGIELSATRARQTARDLLRLLPALADPSHSTDGPIAPRPSAPELRDPELSSSAN